MNAFLFEAIQALSFFSVMLVAMLLAIICASGFIGIVFYVLGAVIQLMSLIGNVKIIGFSGMLGYFVLYFIIAWVALLLILKRRSK